jgi:hypothetical protein
MESLRALLLGGIAFETPTTGRSSEISSENHEFPLFADQDAAKNSSYNPKIPLVGYFHSSVRGLAPGSDVVMHGLKVGKVTDVGLTFDIAKDTVMAPVHFEVEPERGPHATPFKAKVVLAAIKGEKILAELVTIAQATDVEFVLMAVPPVEGGLDYTMEMAQMPGPGNDEPAPDRRLDLGQCHPDLHRIGLFIEHGQRSLAQ